MEVNVISAKVLEINPSGSKLVANSDPLLKNADLLVQNQKSDALRRKFNFTKKALDSLRPPVNEQRAYFYDEQVRGLTVAVSPAGRKTFALYRKVNGRPARINRAQSPQRSTEPARGKAGKMNSAIAEPENPRARQRTMKTEITLGEPLAV